MTRTTVTLDADVEQLLRDAMQRSRRSFKETLNEAIRLGLKDRRAGAPEPPFLVRARSMACRAGIDPLRLNQTVDELEAEAFLEHTKRLGQSEKAPRRHKPR